MAWADLGPSIISGIGGLLGGKQDYKRSSRMQREGAELSLQNQKSWYGHLRGQGLTPQEIVGASGYPGGGSGPGPSFGNAEALANAGQQAGQMMLAKKQMASSEKIAETNAQAVRDAAYISAGAHNRRTDNEHSRGLQELAIKRFQAEIEEGRFHLEDYRAAVDAMTKFIERDQEDRRIGLEARKVSLSEENPPGRGLNAEAASMVRNIKGGIADVVDFDGSVDVDWGQWIIDILLIAGGATFVGVGARAATSAGAVLRKVLSKSKGRPSNPRSRRSVGNQSKIGRSIRYIPASGNIVDTRTGEILMRGKLRNPRGK